MVKCPYCSHSSSLHYGPKCFGGIVTGSECKCIFDIHTPEGHHEAVIKEEMNK